MKKACIFDLDGTLTNTLKSIAYFVNQAITKYDLPPLEPDAFKTLTGDGARTLIKRVLKKNGIENLEMENQILTEYNASYDAAPLYLCEAYEGISEMLHSLKEKSLTLTVLTNKPEQTAQKVVHSIFGDNVFSIILGQKDGFPVKPDPSGAFEIISRLHLEKGDFIYVGDTATDIRTGKNAGLFTVGVLWGFRCREELEKAGADAIIVAPNELYNYL